MNFGSNVATSRWHPKYNFHTSFILAIAVFIERDQFYQKWPWEQYCQMVYEFSNQKS
jgi:hypothetical protein